MLEKKITIRVPDALHLKVKMRMLDQFGDDNFQRLLVAALESFVADGGAPRMDASGPKSTATAKEQKQVSDFLEFLRTGEKSDVHTVLSLIARLSAHRSEMGESLPERKIHSR
jgi:hypothetical protein